ncbi:RNA polymerase sigma factor [Mucilaginibacter psychrotolerans]|uniref:RNA polymerase sigma-70 factor n=1 Tax=Mucilaginibacter psychrotolerans TaxID=1524096 RepID=A0A4Y8SFB4_9SPHI|nr:RNA polymerase sigma-70 factor [Mucilaginibacter psychrotolerans]TFF37773.1 RNA polymerase sigma-70 factor [Mucilaginibacter psychrotolerans]
MLYTTLTDTELVELLRHQDRLAFSEIFNRHWGHLYVHALKMLKDEDEAKDIVQDVFTSLWTKSGSYQILSSLQAYLFGCVRHRVLNYLRDKNTRNTYTDLFSIFLQHQHNAVLEKIEEKELLDAINAVIESLPEKMKRVFELSRKEFLTHKEISEKLNISEKTVKRQISNALSILKTHINKPENMILVLFLSSFK